MYTTEEAFEICKSIGIATNIVSFRRMMREGKIKVIKPEIETNYRQGYHIRKEDLELFIKEKAPRVLELMKENEELKRRITQLEKENTE